jgi:hypothetical protein
MVVRYVERILLGTPYPRIVSKARDLVSAPELQGNCKLIVDASGVGVPVVDMLRHARLGCEMTPIGITGGEHAHQHYANGSPYWTVPRQDLIAGVHLLLEQDELRIAPEMRETGTLVRELTGMNVSAKNRGKARPGASGGREHDDLVFAVALACWKAMNTKSIGFGPRRLPGI